MAGCTFQDVYLLGELDESGRLGLLTALPGVYPKVCRNASAVHPGQAERTRAFAIYLGIGGAFSVIGPAIGGPCAQYLLWQAGFLLNVPTGGAAIALLLCPGSHIPPAQPERIAESLEQQRLWARLPSSAVTVLACVGFAMTVATVYTAVDVHTSMRLSPLSAGLVLVPLVMPVLAATRWVAASGGRYPARKLGQAGTVAMAVGLAMIAVAVNSAASPASRCSERSQRHGLLRQAIWWPLPSSDSLPERACFCLALPHDRTRRAPNRSALRPTDAGDHRRRRGPGRCPDRLFHAWDDHVRRVGQYASLSSNDR